MGAHRICSVLLSGFFGSSSGLLQEVSYATAGELLPGFRPGTADTWYVDCNHAYTDTKKKFCKPFEFKDSWSKCVRKDESEKLQSVLREYEGMISDMEELANQKYKVDVPSNFEHSLTAECEFLEGLSQGESEKLAKRADTIYSTLSCSSTPTGNPCCFDLNPTDSRANSILNNITELAKGVPFSVSSSLLECPAACALAQPGIDDLKKRWDEAKEAWRVAKQEALGLFAELRKLRTGLCKSKW